MLADFTRFGRLQQRGAGLEESAHMLGRTEDYNATHHAIEGVGYDPTNVAESRFAVDIVYHKVEIDFLLGLRYFAPPTYVQNHASS